MLAKEEITKGNDLIRIFMGYKFHLKVYEDFSDCGGIYDRIDLYSKVPIEYQGYENDENYLVENWWRDNYLNFFYKYEDADCLYNTTWDWIIPVAKQCMDLLDTVSDEVGEHLFTFGMSINKALLDMNIEKLWRSVVEYIKKYNEVS